MKQLTVYHAGIKTTADIYREQEEPEFVVETKSMPTWHDERVTEKVYLNNEGNFAVKVINKLRNYPRIFEIVYWSGRRVEIGGNISYKLEELP